MFRGIKKLHNILGTVTCAVLPLYFFGSWFGLESMINSVSHALVLIVRIMLTAGVVLVFFDLWKSKFTNDNKLYWTILGLVFMPVTLPLYWFGMRHRKINAGADHEGNN